MAAETVDVAVVGAGVMGCATAWRLATRGLRVVVFEAEHVAAGSSSRGAGGFRHQFPEELEVRLSTESIAFYAASADALGTAVPYHPHGYLFLAPDAATLDELDARAGTARRLGIPVERRSAEELATDVPGLRVDDLAGGVICRHDGYGDPPATTRAFAAAARAAGAEIREGCPVTGAVRDGDRLVRLETRSGPVAPGAVVVAAGAWSGRVGALLGVELHVRPLRRQLLFSEAVSALPERVPMTIETDTGFHFRPYGDGVLLASPAGAQSWDFDTEPDPEPMAGVIARARRRFAPLRDVAFPGARAGLYEMTPDARPLLGRHPSMANLVACCGFSGHGFMHAPAATRLAAALAAGEEPELDLAAYAPDRFDGLDELPEPAVL